MVNSFHVSIFFKGEYFSGVNIFRGDYFSRVNIFQGRLVFKEEYFPRVIFFKGWKFFRYTDSLNIWLSHNLLGLVLFTICVVYWKKYAVNKKFPRPPVAPLATNIRSELFTPWWNNTQHFNIFSLLCENHILRTDKNHIFIYQWKVNNFSKFTY